MPSHFRRDSRVLLILGLVALVLTGCKAERKIETKATRTELFDLNDRPADPLQTSSAKALVFLFTRTDCPISNRYAPEVQRLHEKLASRDVKFYLVYVDSDQSTEEIHKHMKEYSYTCDALRDPEHSLVAMTQATVTPEAAVFVQGKTRRRMVYRGRIDDRYVDFGKARPEPTRRDLEEFLESIIAGKTVTSTTTPAVGCFIGDLK